MAIKLSQLAQDSEEDSRFRQAPLRGAGDPPRMESHGQEGQMSELSSYSLSNQDAEQWLRGLPSESVDLVITDPPYESLEKHRAVGTTTRLKHSKASSNDWFEIFPNDRFPALFEQVYRVLKPHRHFYLFCDQETMFVAKPIGEQQGFRFWKPLVWDKCKIGMGYHYRSRYELILFFEKGKRKLSDLSIPDILAEPRVYRGYPAEKPPQISEILVKQSTSESDVVIDPFSGSGSVGVAALSQRRRFWGNDKCKEAVEVARSRLMALGQEVPLPDATGQLEMPLK